MQINGERENGTMEMQRFKRIRDNEREKIILKSSTSTMMTCTKIKFVFTIPAVPAKKNINPYSPFGV